MHPRVTYGPSLGQHCKPMGYQWPTRRLPMCDPWLAHGLHMGYTRATHEPSLCQRIPWVTMSVRWATHGLSLGYPRAAQGLPMGYTMASHGLTMDRYWVTTGTHGLPIRGDSWATHGLPVITGPSLETHGLPIGGSWATHGLPIGDSWAIHGLPVGYFRAKARTIAGPSLETHGLHVGDQ